MKASELALIAAALTFAACTSTEVASSDDLDGDRLEPAAESAPGSAPITSLSALSLERALELCDSYHPRLRELAARVEGAEGQIQQSGVLPNPNLVARVEQVPTRGAPNQFIQPILGISQDLPLGGRRGRARELATAERDAERRALELARIELHRSLRGAFATALYMERVSELQRTIAELAVELVRISEARVSAGDLSPEELSRAELETFRVKAEGAKVEALRLRALAELAAALGLPGVAIDRVSGSLEQGLEIGRAERLLTRLETAAPVRLADARIKAERARLALIEAERSPDISLDLFYRRLEDDKVDSFDIGVSVPLGLFDRREGDLRSARARIEEEESRRRRVRGELERAIRTASASLRGALNRAALLRDEILPRSRVVMRATRARFEAGDIELSELLLRRRDDVAIQLSYLGALREVMVSWAEISSIDEGTSAS